MATIQVRDIPEETYEAIRDRAKAEGKSLQSYMRDQIVALAARRTKAEALAAVEAALAAGNNPGPTPESILADLDHRE